MDFDWKALVRTVAPAIGGAISGPAGPLVAAGISALGNVLLGDPGASEADVAAAVQSGKLSGDNIVALRKADQDFKVELARINADIEKAYLADTSDARRQTVDLAKAGSSLAWGPAVISCLIVGGYFICIYLLFVIDRTWDERTAGLLNVLFGALTIGFGQVCNYWLGSSAGSKSSGDAVRQIAQQAAQTGGKP